MSILLMAAEEFLFNEIKMAFDKAEPELEAAMIQELQALSAKMLAHIDAHLSAKING